MTPTTGRGRVVVVGSANVDEVVTVERHPLPGETVTGSSVARRAGGKGANQALAAAAAGAVVTLVGRIGADSGGRAYASALRTRAVDVGRLVSDPDLATGSAVVLVAASGENSIVVVPGANAAVSVADVRAAEEEIAAADVLLVQFEIPMAAVVEAVRIAAQAGTRVVVNPSPYQPIPPEVLSVADPLVVNEIEAVELVGLGLAAGVADDPELMRTSGARSVVLTLGGKGAVWVDAALSVHIPSPDVPVVDTTGAGDAFTGALGAALANGVTPVEAVRRAVIAGAEAVGHPGAQEWEL